MKSDLSIIRVLTILILAQGCMEKAPLSDAYGNFEAREVIVAAETSGRLLQFGVEEGQHLKQVNLLAWWIPFPCIFARSNYRQLWQRCAKKHRMLSRRLLF